MATLLKKRQKKQASSTSIVYAGKGNVISISFKNKTTMKNFVEDFEMSQNESIKKDAKDALHDIKHGKTRSLNAFLKAHGA